MTALFDYEKVGACLERISLPNGAKLLTRDYQAQGKYPVIDQGQARVAGWTDRDEGVISDSLPVIVFGDHSRTFKYVDFPFVRGADGTQILKPRSDIDPLYFFYACRSLDLTSRGYNRHFSLLKSRSIPIPDQATQVRIAEVLRLVEDYAAHQEKQLSAARALKRTAARDLFTRGLHGEQRGETEIGLLPESWAVVPLGSLGRIGNGSTPKRSFAAYWNAGTFPWLTSAKVYDRDIHAAEQHVTDTALVECHLPRVQPGAVLMAITGQGKTLGNVAVLKIEATISQHVAYVQADGGKAEPDFIRGYLETQYDNLRRVASGGGSTKGALTCAFLKRLPFPLPPVKEQQEIADVLQALDRKITLHIESLSLLQELFTSLLRKLMTGEINPDNLILPPNSSTTEGLLA